ncbi:hypothetical protein [Paenibacillus plantiphilus]|uniref:hypothetical protein n=1 Tax=Paenibacillus plantiphilus TaxID=2905650 RepID=UPI001F2987E5|nr:hypothetical protein [Paenibacillus plantiphilus]
MSVMNDPAEIRPICKADIPSVIELLHSEGMNYGSVELHQSFFHKVLIGGEIAGCVAVIPRRGFSEIKSLVVLKKYRSFSIFSKISDFVTYKSLQQNNPCVVVKVNKYNSATLLYRRRRFVPLTKERYEDIYNQLRADCIACHIIVQSICHPVYMVIDTRITPYDIKEWQAKVGEV